MTSKSYRVHFHAGASASVTVTVDELDDADETREAAIEAAYEAMGDQYICASCTGWGKPWSMDLGDWELDDEDDAVNEVQP